MFLLFLGSRDAFTPRPNERLERLVFMALASPSAAVTVAAPPPSMSKDTLAALTVEAPPEPEIPKPEPPMPEMPPPPPPEPELPKPEVTPPPPKPDVKVGAFDAPASNTPAAMPKGSVQTTGFDAPTAAAPDLKLRAAQTGLFGGSAQARPGTDRRGSVATSGFEGGQVRQATRPAGGQVVSSGFGSGAPAAPAARPAGTVQPAGFGDTAVTPPVAAAAPAPKLQVPPTPVEVLSKPTPTYTDEARAARIEGDVILEVVFAANRKVKVIRVVRGLGHGLDDMARAAAEKLTFRPATQAGEPVDVRATVTIVFRLT